MAVAHGHLQTARMLLDAGAASLPDVDGRIPPQINHCSRSQYDKFTLLPLGESLGPPIAPPRPGPATASPSGCPPTCGNQTQETDGSHRAHSAHARESRRRASGLCSDDKVDKVYLMQIYKVFINCPWCISDYFINVSTMQQRLISLIFSHHSKTFIGMG